VYWANKQENTTTTNPQRLKEQWEFEACHLLPFAGINNFNNFYEFVNKKTV